MKEYRLSVEFPFTGDFSNDEKLEQAVGFERSGSGAGMGFRDMEWFFDGGDAKQKALDALDRVHALKIPELRAFISPEEEESCPN